MSDLKPCRFCGVVPHAWLDDYINGRAVTDPYYIIECENADCSVYPEIRGIWPHMDEVRAMWNSANALPPVQPDAADIRIATLQKAEESLRKWQDNLILCGYKEAPITVGMAADLIATLKGETT